MPYWTKGSIWGLYGVHEKHGTVMATCCLVGAITGGREEIAERLSALVEKTVGNKFTLKTLEYPKKPTYEQA